MLNIHVVHRGGQRYYLDDLSLEGDGPPHGEQGWWARPVTWVGEGARRLGLVGEVSSDDFAAVLEGCRPGSGERLRRLHGNSTVSGYDLVFCAPKSVSVLHTLAPTEIGVEVGHGHDAAVGATVDYLARRAVGVVRSAGPDRRAWHLPATGVVGGALVHQTSRSLDPHLHTHMVVANVAEGVDGRWSALDGRRVFAHLGTAQALYHSVLRSELTSRLGVAWEVRPSGLGDVVGVDPGVRRIFSQRTAAIEEHLVAMGLASPGPGWRAKQVAAAVTRPDKERGCSRASLVVAWRSRAADFGFDLGDLSRVVGRGLRRDDGVATVDPERLVQRVTDLRPERTLARRDVERLVAEASLGGASVELVEATADRLVQGMSTEPTRGDVHGGGEPRWSTPALLAALDGQGHDMLAVPGLGHDDRGVSDPADRGRGVSDRPDRGRGVPDRPDRGRMVEHDDTRQHERAPEPRLPPGPDVTRRRDGWSLGR